MKVLVTIPHFYKGVRGSRYGSQATDGAARARAFSRCVSSLHRVLGGKQHMTNLVALFADPRSTPNTVLPIAGPANAAITNRIDIVVLTVGEDHLLDRVPFLRGAFAHHPVQCDSRLLGFECHAVLSGSLGGYDYYCYTEDDLVIHDPWFFVKLRHFCDQNGDDALPQPNRFEFAENVLALKAYVDGDLPREMTSRFQDVRDRPEVQLSAVGVSAACSRTSNPHAGCFFLNSRQMERWCGQPYFLDRDSSFVGPLESAATLGIMRTFRIYKPVARVASFFEIQHSGDGWIRRLAAIQSRL